MKEKRLLYAIGWVKDEYIEEMGQPGSGQKIYRIPQRRIWLIAAIIALALLLVGCTVVYVLRLQNLKIDEEVITWEDSYGPSGEYIPGTEWVNSYLSRQGYEGSPEYQALREWREFQEQYDPDMTLMKANNFNQSGVPEQYNIIYGCYTFEMMDKLNEILDKYQLKPLSTWIFTDDWETPLFYQALQIQCLTKSGSGAEELGARFSVEGSFFAEFWQRLEGEEEERIVTYTYAKNGYLYPDAATVNDIEQWEQWDYTTTDGIQVLLATYQNRLAIFCERSDAVISISTKNRQQTVPFDSNAEPMTRQKAEQIADSFRYDIQPQTFDPAQVEAMRADYPEPEERHHILEGFAIDSEGDRWIPPEEIGDTFEHYIDYLLANPKKRGGERTHLMDYALTDLNQDGQQELLLRYRDTEQYSQIVQMSEAPDEGFFIRFINGNVYEGPVFERISIPREEDPFYYFELKDVAWNDITCLRYDPEQETWSQSDSKGYPGENQWAAISESEAERIRDAYIPISLEWKPLTEFSMNG